VTDLANNSDFSERIYNDCDDQLGYRAVKTGNDIPTSEALLEPINPKAQAEFEKILWMIRQK